MLGRMIVVFAIYLADGKGLAMTDEVQRGGSAKEERPCGLAVITEE